MKLPIIILEDSIIRWVETIVQELTPKTYKRFWEPFCGGAIVAYNMPRHKTIIGDTYPDLINVYKVLKNPVESSLFFEDLQALEGEDEEMLEEMFGLEGVIAPTKAALFLLLYLPKVDIQRIIDFGKWLERVVVYEGGYECITPKKDDLVFLHPPNDFDFEELVCVCEGWDCRIIGVAPDNDDTRHLFTGYNLTRLRTDTDSVLLFRSYGRALHTIQKFPIVE